MNVIDRVIKDLSIRHVLQVDGPPSSRAEINRAIPDDEMFPRVPDINAMLIKPKYPVVFDDVGMRAVSVPLCRV